MALAAMLSSASLAGGRREEALEGRGAGLVARMARCAEQRGQMVEAALPRQTWRARDRETEREGGGEWRAQGARAQAWPPKHERGRVGAHAASEVSSEASRGSHVASRPCARSALLLLLIKKEINPIPPQTYN